MAARRPARSSWLLLPLLCTLLACQDEPPVRDTSPGSQGNSPATAITAAANAAVLEELG